jgi:hypothetical protein
LRDRVISLIVVGVVVALVWVVGSKMREQPSRAADAALMRDALVVEDAARNPVAVQFDASVVVDASFAEERGVSAPCRAMETASQLRLDEAKSAGYCVDLSLSDVKCKTSANGATWGVRIDDVVDLDVDAASCPTGWLMHVVHVAADGSEQVIVPPGPGGVRKGHAYNVYKAAPVYVIALFDWDGDGEDEIVIGRWTSVFVWTFKRGHIVAYPPASSLAVEEVSDVDGDGRPDLLVRPFGDAPTALQFVAHSLPDGTFTLHDAVAVKQAQTVCPADPQITLNSDEESLANDIACALVWGRDPKALGKELCAPDAGACPPWVKRMLASKAPLSLR